MQHGSSKCRLTLNGEAPSNDEQRSLRASDDDTKAECKDTQASSTEQQIENGNTAAHGEP